jgi:excisionase family DNA binding protein
MGAIGITASLELIAAALVGQKDVLTMADFCLYTGYSEGYTYRLTSERRVPFFKRGGSIFFKREEVNQWLTANRVKTKAEIEEEAATYCAIGRSNARSIKRAI